MLRAQGAVLPGKAQVPQGGLVRHWDEYCPVGSRYRLGQVSSSWHLAQLGKLVKEKHQLVASWTCRPCSLDDFWIYDRNDMRSSVLLGEHLTSPK
mgnify:CR=1 FL=1